MQRTAKKLLVSVFWMVLVALVAPIPLVAQGYPSLATAPQIERTGEKDVAVIVAAEAYTFLPPVHGAVDTANDWEIFFEQGLGVRNIHVLVNQQSTDVEMRRFARQAAEEVQPGGTLWFVFIGHGAPAPEGDDGLLIGIDAQQNFESLVARGVRQQELLDLFDQGQQEQTVFIVDACFSGRSTDGAALIEAQPVLPVDLMPRFERTTVILSAAQAEEFAGPLPHARRPAFSYLLLGALRGWAASGEEVSASQALNFTRRALRGLPGRFQQTPGLFGTGDIVLVRGAREADPGIYELMRQEPRAARHSMEPPAGSTPAMARSTSPPTAPSRPELERPNRLGCERPAVAETDFAGAVDDDYLISTPRIFNRVILQIRENYVDSDRVVPQKMLVGALESLAIFNEEVTLGFDRERNPTTVEVSVRGVSQSFALSVDSLWEMSLRLSEIGRFLEGHLFWRGARARLMEHHAMQGALATLDPHSEVLAPGNYREMQTMTGGSFGGVGMVISCREGQIVVISAIEGTPAHRAGLPSGSILLSVDGHSLQNVSLSQAVQRLRGQVGSTVEVVFRHPEETTSRKVQIRREQIRIDSVESRLLAGKVGYLRIKNFQASTSNDVRAHLIRLKSAEPDMQGLVLDLRGNPGGLLEQSIRVSDLFLSRGQIVTTTGMNGTLRETQSATAETIAIPPVVVLVDGGTASAAEIVTGALSENGHALVIGERTFGKGTVQVLYEFPDGSALKLTVAQYLLASGHPVEAGILPALSFSEVPQSSRPEVRWLLPLIPELESMMELPADP